VVPRVKTVVVDFSFNAVFTVERNSYDQDAVWRVVFCGPKESCARCGADTTMESHNLGRCGLMLFYYSHLLLMT